MKILTNILVLLLILSSTNSYCQRWEASSLDEAKDILNNCKQFYSEASSYSMGVTYKSFHGRSFEKSEDELISKIEKSNGAVINLTNGVLNFTNNEISIVVDSAENSIFIGKSTINHSSLEWDLIIDKQFLESDSFYLNVGKDFNILRLRKNSGDSSNIELYYSKHTWQINKLVMMFNGKGYLEESEYKIDPLIRIEIIINEYRNTCSFDEHYFDSLYYIISNGESIAPSKNFKDFEIFDSRIKSSN